MPRANATTEVSFDRDTLRALREMTEAIGQFTEAVRRLERLQRRAAQPLHTGSAYADPEPLAESEDTEGEAV